MTVPIEQEQMVLPALRGIMGDWVFYSCLMGIDEVAHRVNFAKEIHQNKKLSDMIQRQITQNRGKQIARYINEQKEHFFNSLVIATYKGNPNWYSFGEVSKGNQDIDLPELPEDVVGSIGFLTFSGAEKLFAVDGQHRLAGIKNVVEKGSEQDPWDDISIILVAHKNNLTGRERTRRLFTTLNKTARPVSHGDIIALDEDDVMAITTRRLIEETKLFSQDRIAFSPTNNMPGNNSKSLTTIGNLYKILQILFTTMLPDGPKKKEELTRIRPSDQELDFYFDFAKKFFNLLSKNFPVLHEFFKALDYAEVTARNRGSFGGNVMFRPVGIEIIVQVISHLNKKGIPQREAVKLASGLPLNLNEEPFLDVLWNSGAQTMYTRQHAVTIREVLLYMLGHSKETEIKLLGKYRKATGNDEAELPSL